MTLRTWKTHQAPDPGGDVNKRPLAKARDTNSNNVCSSGAVQQSRLPRFAGVSLLRWTPRVEIKEDPTILDRLRVEQTRQTPEKFAVASQGVA
ncbi:MAG: hypothetical protein ACPL8I_09360, partial [Chloroflexaceae bacterium]